MEWTPWERIKHAFGRTPFSEEEVASVEAAFQAEMKAQEGKIERLWIPGFRMILLQELASRHYISR